MSAENNGDTAAFQWESLNGMNVASLRQTDDGRVALTTGHGPEDQRTSTTVLLPASAAGDLAVALMAWLSERAHKSVGRGPSGSRTGES